MSIASEITRLQTAKADLKTSINAKTDAQHQITTETIDEYADFVDSISGGSSTIDVGAEKLKFAYSKFPTIPSYLDFSNVTDFGYMFMANTNLQSVRQIDTSKGTTFTHMFYDSYNSNLTSLPLFNTSKGTNFESIFGGGMYLTSTPAIDTSKGTNTASMFSGCSRLVTIPEYDFSSTTFVGNSFMTSATALTTVGGFKNVGKAFLTSSAANYYAYIVNLSPATSLTHDSLMNVINKVYDIATKGCNTQKLVLGSTNLAKLTSAEIAIATNKGWTVS